ncbi:MAG TPA: PAS domain S-box protein [Gemmatimonadetes bacterium]|nr:PAS domain S-box protein [Gemmatimonadota bacterium]
MTGEKERVTAGLQEFGRRLAAPPGGVLATPRSGATLRPLLAAVETMQLGVVIADESGVMLYANPAQARMYGVDSPEEIIGQEVSIFCVPGYRDPRSAERLEEITSWRRESLNVRERHGGAVWLSTQPGEGTCVRLLFPIAPHIERSEDAVLEGMTLRAETSDGPLSMPGPAAPKLMRRSGWNPVVVGRHCPRCGEPTVRNRMPWYVKPLRLVLRGRVSTRQCGYCYWRGVALHRD